MTDTVRARLQADLKTAMKSKDAPRRDTIRLLLSELKTREIELRRDLTVDEEIRLLQTQAKQRDDAIEQFRTGGREDLAAKDEKQKEIIESYLPSQMSDDELNAFVANAISTTGSADPKDLGKLMGMLSTSAAGRVGGRRLSEEIRQQLIQKEQ